jgi:3-deoxy-D-manno-octulosonic-acid transferase
MKTASAGFVGGSLVPVGGHNLAEPAAFGVPVATGPLLDNVAHQAEALRRANALVVVRDATELAHAWTTWLTDEREASRVAKAAGTALEASRGVLARTLAALEPVLARLDAKGPDLR